MIKILFLHLCSLAFLCASASWASELTLQGAVSEAIDRNPVLARARAALDEASWRRLDALSGNLPHLTILADHYFDTKYQFLEVPVFGQFPEVYPRTLISLQAQWTVFDGFQTWNAYSAAREDKSAAEHELERARFQLESEVKLRYFQSLAAIGLKTVAEQNVKTLKDHLVLTKELLAQGQATKFDLLRTQTQLEEAEPEAIQADDELELARTALARAMGADSEGRELAGPLPLPPTDPAAFAPDKIKAASGARDDIDALLLRADAASDLKASSIGAWLPKVSLGFQEDFYNNSVFAASSGLQNAYGVGIFLSWSLFDGGASLARLQEARAQAAQADATARAAQIRVPGELDQWRRRLLYSMSLFKARTRAIESAQESLRLAKLGFTAGTRTNSDVLDAELDLFRAAAGRIRAQVDSLEALLNLEAALGRRL